MSSTGLGTNALGNLEVIDLTRLAPGPYCTMVLADFGARVLRVEEFGPLTGRRAAQSQTADGVQAEGTQKHVGHVGFVEPHSPYNALNRNKRSIALNLKSDPAREVFYELVRRADVVVEEFRPGVTQRLGIGYDTLKEINPRIIYCAITGYGQTGPYRSVVGHDINYLSMAGALSVMGKPGEPPTIPGNILSDYGGALHAVVGILAAVIARETTGRGQFVDLALTDSVVSMMAHMLSWSYETGIVPGPGEHVTAGYWPPYNVYETKDGKYISIGCMEPWFYANLCRTLGREDLIPHQFSEEKREEIFRIFRERFRTKTRDEWFSSLPGDQIPVSKVYTLDELSSDPHLRAREMIVEVEHPTAGKILQAGVPAKLSETPGRIHGMGPELGEHTEEVLRELGYSPSRISELVEARAVQLLASER